MTTPSTSTRVPPAALSDLMWWLPELMILTISLAFAGAFGWPLLGIPALLATSRIVGGRYLHARRNERAIRDCEAARQERAGRQAAAADQSEDRALPAIGGSDPR